MATNTSLCAICDLQHISKPSTDWCLMCDEALCSECKELHNLQKASRDHNTISISDYQTLPQNILEIRQYCLDHDEKLSMFCPKHDCPICIKCMKNHNECKSIAPLENIVSDVKKSEAFQDIIKSLDNLDQNIKMINVEKQSILGNISEKKRKYEDKVRSVREKINTHLDNLQKQIMAELDATQDKVCKNIQKLTAQLKENENDLQNHKSTMKSIEQYASDLQAFLGIKEIQQKLGKNEELLESAVENINRENVEMVCDIDSKITEILSEVTRFGSVKLQPRPTKINIVRQKDREAQIVYSPSRSINDIKVRLAQKIRVGKPGKERWVRGCSITPNGNFIFACTQYDELISMKPDNSIDFEISLKPNGAFDIALINNNTVVVTSGYYGVKSIISLVDLATKKIINHKGPSGKTYGITCNDKYVFVCVAGTGIQLLDRSSLELSTLIYCNVIFYCYVAVYEENIYVTNHRNNTVICYMNGQKKWAFLDKSILEKPEGIITDNVGNIFVVGKTSNNVVVISSDGQQCRQILSKEDGLNAPTALSFDKSEGKLLVANLNSEACLYDVL